MLPQRVLPELPNTRFRQKINGCYAYIDVLRIEQLAAGIDRNWKKLSSNKGKL